MSSPTDGSICFPRSSLLPHHKSTAHSPQHSRTALRFTPKEDIAGNAPLKSSLQRQIRNKILEQYPYLSLPALPLPKSLVPDAADSDEELEEEDLGKRKKGAGKEKKSKKEGKGGKKGRKQADEVEEVEQKEEGGNAGEEEVLTVMDTLWPKKEGCSLVKWYEETPSLDIERA